MAPEQLQVLWEDNHVLAVAKPAGLPTMGTPGGKPTLLTVAKEYVKQRYAKPGNVYLGVVSRLDAPVTGVVLLARTSKAARRLTEQFRSRSVRKVYWALVEGVIEPAAGVQEAAVAKDHRSKRMRIVGKSFPGAQEARLRYRRVAVLGGRSLVEVELETGRKHQIRLQLSAAGHPVVGDFKYGSRSSFPAGIALHARRVEFAHPVRGETIAVEAPLPQAWRSAGINEDTR